MASDAVAESVAQQCQSARAGGSVTLGATEVAGRSAPRQIEVFTEPALSVAARLEPSAHPTIS